MASSAIYDYLLEQYQFFNAQIGDLRMRCVIDKNDTISHSDQRGGSFWRLDVIKLYNNYFCASYCSVHK